MWLAEGLELVRMYYQRGNTKSSSLRYEIKDPPTSGWQNALVIRGPKRSTVFCPYSLQSWTITNEAAELKGIKDVAHEMKHFRAIQDRLRANWDQYQNLGMHRDYDTAALIFKKMGVKAPEQKLKGGEEDTRKKGGKDVASELIKPVKRSGKRGKFLEWFLDADGSRSVRETMAEFGMSRSNALSYLYMLKKDHGIGYELVGDVATVSLPEGCDDPFEDGLQTHGTDSGDSTDGQEEKTGKPEEEAEDDSWLD